MLPIEIKSFSKRHKVHNIDELKAVLAERITDEHITLLRKLPSGVNRVMQVSVVSLDPVQMKETFTGELVNVNTLFSSEAQ